MAVRCETPTHAPLSPGLVSSSSAAELLVQKSALFLLNTNLLQSWWAALRWCSPGSRWYWSRGRTGSTRCLPAEAWGDVTRERESSLWWLLPTGMPELDWSHSGREIPVGSHDGSCCGRQGSAVCQRAVECQQLQGNGLYGLCRIDEGANANPGSQGDSSEEAADCTLVRESKIRSEVVWGKRISANVMVSWVLSWLRWSTVL